MPDATIAAVPGNRDRLPRLAFVGYGEAGKDEAANYISANTPLRHGGSTSVHLLPYMVARRLGCTVERARARLDYEEIARALYDRRHAARQEWYDEGNRIRAADPGVLVRAALAAGELLVGCRDVCEIVYARDHGLVDLTLWVANRRVPPDPTVMFGPEVADLVIENHVDLASYHRRLAALCRFAGVPMFSDPAAAPARA
jgi:hypothetical protein